MVPWSLLMPLVVHWRMVLEMDDFVEMTQLCGNILRFYAEAQKIYGADWTHNSRWDGGCIDSQVIPSHSLVLEVEHNLALDIVT